MHEPPPEAETGLPDRRGEVTTSLPWSLRFLLAAAIGAVVGFIVSTAFALGTLGGVGGWATVGALASASTLLAIRKVHAWHLSTFADGMLVGLVAWPIMGFLFMVLAWRQFSIEVFILGALLRGIGLLVILVPSGWIAGFAYHVALLAAERARRGEDDSS